MNKVIVTGLVALGLVGCFNNKEEVAVEAAPEAAPAVEAAPEAAPAVEGPPTAAPAVEAAPAGVDGGKAAIP